MNKNKYLLVNIMTILIILLIFFQCYFAFVQIKKINKTLDYINYEQMPKINDDINKLNISVKELSNEISQIQITIKLIFNRLNMIEE